MTLWAVFKDYRGVAYCELVNEAISVYTYEVPARPVKKHWLTRKVIHPARSADRRIHTVFDDKVYSREDYLPSAFTPPPKGYVFQHGVRYLKDNRWGPVDVILFITDDKLGQSVSNELRQLSPEGNLNHGTVRIRDAKPHPSTNQIIGNIAARVK